MLAPPNSVVLIALASIVEAVIAATLYLGNIHRNVYHEGVVRLGSLYTCLQLALHALHRISIRADPRGTGYSAQMVAITVTYFILVVVMFLGVIIGPWVRKKYKQNKDDAYFARELAKYNNDDGAGKHYAAEEEGEYFDEGDATSKR